MQARVTSSFGGRRSTSVQAFVLVDAPYGVPEGLARLVGEPVTMFEHECSDLSARIGGSYTDSDLRDPANQSVGSVDGLNGPEPGYTLWNCTLGWNRRPDRTGFAIVAEVANLFDESCFRRFAIGIHPGAPRQEFVALTYTNEFQHGTWRGSVFMTRLGTVSVRQTPNTVASGKTTRSARVDRDRDAVVERASGSGVTMLSARLRFTPMALLDTSRAPAGNPLRISRAVPIQSGARRDCGKFRRTLRTRRWENPPVRNFFWFGLYLVLALAPLAVAVLFDPIDVIRPLRVEVAIGFGFVAFALLALEFSLVSRIRVVSNPFGNDALMLFHRKMGVAAVTFLIAHALLVIGHGAHVANWSPFQGSPAQRTGALAAWAVIVLVALSLLRRRISLRYELWQVSHRVLAILTVGAMLAHTLAVDGYTTSPIVRGALIAYAGLFLALMLHYRIVRPWRGLRTPWRIVENRAEAGDVRTLVLRPVAHSGFEFEPGQFAWISTSSSFFLSEEHPISIASSSERRAPREIELSIKALGDWSRDVVPRLAVGGEVRVHGPFGAFTLDRVAAQEFVLIAGGIGVTPLRSMLLSMRDRGDPRRVTLVYAARNRSRATFADEADRLVREMNLSVVFVFEEPSPEPRCEQGLVTASILRKHLPVDLRRVHFFVCGPAPMMDALETLLSDLHISSKRVHTERFDMV